MTTSSQSSEWREYDCLKNTVCLLNHSCINNQQRNTNVQKDHAHTCNTYTARQFCWQNCANYTVQRESPSAQKWAFLLHLLSTINTNLRTTLEETGTAHGVPSGNSLRQHARTLATGWPPTENVPPLDQAQDVARFLHNLHCLSQTFCTVHNSNTSITIQWHIQILNQSRSNGPRSIYSTMHNTHTELAACGITQLSYIR